MKLVVLNTRVWLVIPVCLHKVCCGTCYCSWNYSFFLFFYSLHSKIMETVSKKGSSYFCSFFSLSCHPAIWHYKKRQLLKHHQINHENKKRLLPFWGIEDKLMCYDGVHSYFQVASFTCFIFFEPRRLYTSPATGTGCLECTTICKRRRSGEILSIGAYCKARYNAI